MSGIKSDVSKTIESFFDVFKKPSEEEINKQKEIESSADKLEKKVRENLENNNEHTSNEIQDATQRESRRPNRQSTSQRLNSVSQKNKPDSSIVINKSNTVKVIAPKEKDDAFFIIDELKREQPVLVQFNSIESGVREEILDLIYGACHFAGLKIEQAGELMILIDPNF